MGPLLSTAQFVLFGLLMFNAGTAGPHPQEQVVSLEVGA